MLRKVLLLFNILLLLSMVISSCASGSIVVKKRKYRSGYHVDWGSKNKPARGQELVERKEAEEQVEEPLENQLEAMKEETESQPSQETIEQEQYYQSDDALTAASEEALGEMMIRPSPSIHSKRPHMPHATVSSEGAETHWGTIVGFVSGILGIMSLVTVYDLGVIFFFLLLSIVPSGIALDRHKREPDNWKNVHLAKAARVMGIVLFAVFIIGLLSIRGCSGI